MLHHSWRTQVFYEGLKFGVKGEGTLDVFGPICLTAFSGPYMPLTLPMLRLLLYKGQGCKDFWKQSEPCHVRIHLIALTEYSQMSTHVLGFQSFSRCFASFCIELATSTIRVYIGYILANQITRMRVTKQLISW